MKLVYIIFFITISITAHDIIKLGDDIVINICSQYPKVEKYNWLLISKPENSTLDVEEVLNENKENCLIKITPDVVGLYTISISVENNTISFQHEVIESLEEGEVNIKFSINNKCYFNKLNYYKFYNNNNLIFNLNKEFIKFNFEIQGIALVEDLFEGRSFLINTDKMIFIKDNYNYKIIFYPDMYKNFELIFNTKTFNKNQINFTPINNKLNLEVTDSTNNKKIVGITTFYYEDILISDFTNKNKSTENLKAIQFSPIKSINNYPSVKYYGNLAQNISIQYDNIDFYKLKLQTNERLNNSNQHLTIKVKSLSLNKCVINLDNYECKYQQTINTKSPKEISIPSGEYQIEVYKKGYDKLVKTIILNSNQTIELKNTNKKEISEVRLHKDIKFISFSNQKNQNFFFKIESNMEMIELPNDIYNITIFTDYNLYNINSLELNNNFTIEYSSKKINISIYDDNQIIYGGIIIINGENYIYNNGKTHSFSIKE